MTVDNIHYGLDSTEFKVSVVYPNGNTHIILKLRPCVVVFENEKPSRKMRREMIRKIK